VATFNPAGKASVNPTPVNAVPVLGFVMVKVNIVVPPILIVEGEKTLLIDAARALTVNVAEAVLPVPPGEELTVPLVFTREPMDVPLTFTLAMQVPLAAIVPPEKESDVAPAAGAKVGLPQPEMLTPGTEATCKPLGNVSLKATDPREYVLALVIVKIKTVVPFTVTVLGVKDLVMNAGPVTVREAEAVFPIPPLVELTVPLVLFFIPLVVETTFTLTMHVPLAAMVPFVKVKVVAFAVGVKVGDPQPEVLAPGVDATFMSVGSESLNATPVKLVELGLVIVKRNTVLVFTATGFVTKVLLILGG
jgi:hypothetical protein